MRTKGLLLRVSGGLAIIAFALLLSSPVAGCTYVLQTYAVGPEFQAHLKSAIDVDGIPLQLAGVDESRTGRFRAVTSRDGIAIFRNIPKGKYKLTIGTGEALPWVEIEVLSSATGSVELAWPDRDPLRTRRLRGKITTGFEPLAAETLKLADFKTGAPVGVATTGTAGTFAFSEVPAGLYVLTLGQGDGDWLAGDMLVEVDRSAKWDRLDIEVGATTCGLMYAANCQDQVANSSITTSRVRGLVEDVSGAVVPKADVSLSSQDGVLSRSAKTDAAGNFAFADLPAGRFTLVVRTPGFAPLRTEVSVEKGAPVHRMAITLSLAGTCGARVTVAE